LNEFKQINKIGFYDCKPYFVSLPLSLKCRIYWIDK
jgi:hypothetical protein